MLQLPSSPWHPSKQHDCAACLFPRNSILAWVQVQTFTHAGVHTPDHTHTHTHTHRHNKQCAFTPSLKRLSEHIISVKPSLHAMESGRRVRVRYSSSFQNKTFSQINKLAKRHKGWFMTICSISYREERERERRKETEGREKRGGEIPLFFKYNVISWWIFDHKDQRPELLWSYTPKGTKTGRDILASGEGWKRGLTRMF